MKKILYYFVMKPYDKDECYVKIQYANGDIKYLYSGDKGFKSAYNKGMAS
jgi:hypothetical protein